MFLMNAFHIASMSCINSDHCMPNFVSILLFVTTVAHHEHDHDPVAVKPHVYVSSFKVLLWNVIQLSDCKPVVPSNLVRIVCSQYSICMLKSWDKAGAISFTYPCYNLLLYFIGCIQRSLTLPSLLRYHPYNKLHGYAQCGAHLEDHR